MYRIAYGQNGKFCRKNNHLKIVLCGEIIPRKWPPLLVKPAFLTEVLLPFFTHENCLLWAWMDIRIGLCF